MYGGFIQIHNGIRMEMHARCQRQTFRMHFVNHVIFGKRIEHASMAIILIAINLSHLCVETHAVIRSFLPFYWFFSQFWWQYIRRWVLRNCGAYRSSIEFIQCRRTANRISSISQRSVCWHGLDLGILHRAQVGYMFKVTPCMRNAVYIWAMIEINLFI